MKILHCCFANFYIDNYGYQENILTKHHSLQGHDVRILASTENYINNSQLGYVIPSTYINENGISVTRLPYVKWLPHFIAKKLRLYSDIEKQISDFQPDIIFLHGLQFVSIVTFSQYISKNPNVKLFVDGHTDFINSAKNFFSRNILHKIVYRWCAKKIEPYASCFFGVTPLRVKFFEDVYQINKNKTALLVMGVDDSVVNLAERSDIRMEVRQRLGIATDDFVLVTGGKIDARKKIHELMKVVRDININNIKLIVFGTPSDEIKTVYDELSKSTRIITVGWTAPDKVYDYLFAADLGVFPGTHSVLWEQAVGVGLPCVFKKWEGIEHVDVGGNCLMLDQDGPQAIKDAISLIYSDKDLYLNMMNVALDKGISTFIYSKIAIKALGQN